MIDGVAIRSVTGAGIRDVVADLARLRVAIFRAWPYLYEGDEAYERAYVEKYAATDGALVVTAADPRDGAIVGASTALPLAEAEEELHAPFLARGLALGDYYYFGESVLDAGWRGRGIGVAFFAAREAQARALGFAHTAFCAVERPDDHPARPPGHVPLDAFWRRRGYTRRDDLRATLAWRDVGAADETDKPMTFWTRRIAE